MFFGSNYTVMNLFWIARAARLVTVVNVTLTVVRTVKYISFS